MYDNLTQVAGVLLVAVYDNLTQVAGVLLVAVAIFVGLDSQRAAHVTDVVVLVARRYALKRQRSVNPDVLA